MIRKILRQIAKTRMKQEGFNLHKQFIQPTKKGDRSLFAMRWRLFAQKGVIPIGAKILRRRIA
jgi:hypothetical protein